MRVRRSRGSGDPIRWDGCFRVAGRHCTDYSPPFYYPPSCYYPPSTYPRKTPLDGSYSRSTGTGADVSCSCLSPG